MTKKKYTTKVIIEAISRKFGSVGAYAVYKVTSTQNIYNKICRQAEKFIEELKQDGVDLTLGKGFGFLRRNNIEIEKLNPLEKEVKELKDLLILALEEIKGLKEHNERLSVRIAHLVEKYHVKSKLSR